MITFSDVMLGVMTLGMSILTYFVKDWFTRMQKSNEEIKGQINKNNDDVNKRIEKLEEKTESDIADIQKQITDIKGDFATSFVLREDFFRAMNGVEDTIKGIGNKIDKLLLRER